jgi:hypothetical protein
LRFAHLAFCAAAILARVEALTLRRFARAALPALVRGAAGDAAPPNSSDEIAVLMPWS